MGYLALHKHCSETIQMRVTNESLGASVTCRTGAIAWRWGGSQGVAKWAKKNEYYNKNLNFLNPTNFKLLTQMQGNLNNNCDFFKVHNFC
jgi:hypothetical protein